MRENSTQQDMNPIQIWVENGEINLKAIKEALKFAQTQFEPGDERKQIPIEFKFENNTLNASLVGGPQQTDLATNITTSVLNEQDIDKLTISDLRELFNFEIDQPIATVKGIKIGQDVSDLFKGSPITQEATANITASSVYQGEGVGNSQQNEENKTSRQEREPKPNTSLELNQTPENKRESDKTQQQEQNKSIFGRLWDRVKENPGKSAVIGAVAVLGGTIAVGGLVAAGIFTAGIAPAAILAGGALGLAVGVGSGYVANKVVNSEKGGIIDKVTSVFKPKSKEGEVEIGSPTNFHKVDKPQLSGNQAPEREADISRTESIKPQLWTKVHPKSNNNISPKSFKGPGTHREQAQISENHDADKGRG